MNKRRKLIVLLFLPILLLSGCTSGETKTQVNDEKGRPIETIVAKRGNLTPTLSTKTGIAKSTPFELTMPQSGNFEASVKTGDKITQGQVVGKVDGKEIVSPIEADVVAIAPSGKLPKNYAFIELQYTGFSISVKATDFFKGVSSLTTLKGKFQVENGVGPSDVTAVVRSSNQQADSIILQCLISHDIEVREGDLATAVITNEVKKDVLLLPVSAIAGRLQKGSVTVEKDGTYSVVEVGLGATDGAHIEILSGIEEGSKIVTTPPNLDSRQK